MIELDALESAMIAELALPNTNSVTNNLRLIHNQQPALKKELLKVSNMYAELRRQFREGEFTRKEANIHIRDTIIESLRTGAISKMPDPKTRNDNLDPTVRLDQPHALDRFNDTKQSLIKDLTNQGTVMATVPLLAICNPPLLADKLTAAGIPNSKYETYYTILDRQLVVGISNLEFSKKLKAYTDLQDAYTELANMGKHSFKVRKDLDAYHETVDNMRSKALGIMSQMSKVNALAAFEAALTNTKANSSKPATYSTILIAVQGLLTLLRDMIDAIPNKKITAESIYEELVKQASTNMGKNLKMVGRAHVALEASFIWLMTDKEQIRLLKCSAGGHSAITKWGLAFKE